MKNPLRYSWFLPLLFLVAPAAPAERTREFIYERAPFPQCHASTVVETATGTLIAAFFGGEHERHPDVGIWISRRDQERWSPPVEVANGVQFTRPDGSVGYLNRNTLSSDTYTFEPE